MARRNLQGCRILITGASSGIGRELARQLAAAGGRLILTARRQQRLLSLASEITKRSGSAVTVPGDITDRDTRARCLREAREAYGGLDVLVNNAGSGALGPFADATRERLRSVMEVNFFAPAELIRDSLTLLRHGNQPLIVNVGSVLGHRAVPGKSEYCAAKFALHGLTDALRAELAPQGIDVLLVSPSTTRSEFFDRVEDGEQRAPKRHPGMRAETVARRTIRAMQSGKHEIILSAGGLALVWADRLFPALVDRFVARYGPE